MSSSDGAGFHQFVVAEAEAGERLDRIVAGYLPELSRTRVQELIDEGLVLVDGHTAKGASRLHGGEHVRVEVRPRPPLQAEPEKIPLDVLYEDSDVIVVNKPAGMMVHAGAGNSKGTLVNALLGRGQSLSSGGDSLRPGIVHRLDKETSGAIVIAKNDSAHAKLALAFRQRSVKKTYLALVQGALEEPRGRIELAIARDPNRRVRMTTRRGPVVGNARAARTDWRALAKVDAATLMEVQLHTGRTHQIRVHFSALKHPVMGDTLYGAVEPWRIGKAVLPPLRRHFLHAAILGFAQPRTGEWIEARAPLPEELHGFLRALSSMAGDSMERIDAVLSGYL